MKVKTLLRDVNRRLLYALEFYANEENYPKFWLRSRGGEDEMVNLIARDCGQQARDAIEAAK